MTHPEFQPLALTPADSENEGGGIDLRQMLRVLDKHKWAIIGLTLLIGLIAAMFVYRQVPIYRATATLLIERAPVQFSPVQNTYAAYTDHWLYYQTQYGLIKRRAIGERVVNDLGLAEPGPAPPQPPSTGFSWRSLLPDGWLPEEHNAPAPSRYESAIGWVVGGIQVTPRRDSQLVDISFEDPDPSRAAQLANAVSEAFIEDNLEGRMEMTESASAYLTTRLVDLREKLSQSERALQAFKERERMVDVRGVDSMASQELSIATEKVGAARKARLEAEIQSNQVREARQRGLEALAALPAILRNPRVVPLNNAYVEVRRRVSELSQRYGPKHPKMIAANSELEAAREAFYDEVARAADGITRDYQSVLAAEQAAERELETVKERIRVVDTKVFGLAALEREVEANRQIYEKFQTQFKETSATGGMQSANARLVERALVPRSPVKPNKKRVIGMALLLGLLLSIGLAFLLEHLDNTVKGAEDAERRLGLPVLGMLPKLKVSGDDALAPIRYFSENQHSAFSESIRTVRTGVLLSSLDDSHKILLVTSSVPGEGKTTLSMNLARALGEMKKVLLIDADMRRPTVARAMKERGAERGLSHFISGESKLSECVMAIDDSNVHVMHAGLVPPNPLEMLSSHRFAAALDKMASQFDHIVIDCAPSLAVSDAMVLSKLSTAVIYVVKSDSTPVQAARAGLARLKRVGAHVIGAVINQAEQRGRRYYGRYGDYYAGGYDYGYSGYDSRAS